MRRTLAVILTLTGTLLMADDKVAKDVNTTTTAAIPVIVKWKSVPNNAHHDKVRKVGGTLTSAPGLLNVASYTVAGNEIPKIAKDKDVEYVALDHVLRAAADAWIGAPKDYGWRTV